MGLFNKKELNRIQELEEELKYLKQEQQEIGISDCIQAKEKIKQMQQDHEKKTKDIEQNHQKEIESLTQSISSLNAEINQANKKLSKLKNEIELKKREVCDVDETLLNESFGIYTPKYTCMNSNEYAEKIKENREKQKKKIKEKTALNYYDNWTLDGSKAKGQALNNDNMKMVLRAFNNECDVLINKVKFNNIDRIKTQIEKSAKAIDKLNVRNKITITNSYIQLKIEELELVYEYQCKKQEEKEAIREARAAEREQAKLQKEIEQARKVIDKEYEHYSNAREKLVSQLFTASEEDAKIINEKISEMDNKLSEIQKNKEEIDYREANQRAGYVYVISNIGAFGEDIYKIGMTRRLEPQDRVDELGDASVPFTFDVHAMIFSDDAPKLEASLHRAFDNKKVNMVNGRKEFFHVTLEEIEKVIKENHDKLVEIKRIPDAEQYRESLLLKNNHIEKVTYNND